MRRARLQLPSKDLVTGIMSDDVSEPTRYLSDFATNWMVFIVECW
jgi:hypothetical protein